MKKKSEKLNQLSIISDLLDDKSKIDIRGGTKGEDDYTYDGGTLDTIIVTPP